MRIVVCIKQVPGTSQVEIDEETGVLKRDGAAAKINPYDLYALETAMRLKEKCGGTVTAVTMGPPQAKAMMKEAYMMGVDEAYVFSDRTFAGADVLATSYTLAQGITSICDYDIIVCGKQTTDGDTAQVGPAMAEYLGIPCAAWVGEIGDVDEHTMTVGQNFVNVKQLAKMKLPCLITVEKDIFTPRLPSYRLKAATKDREVHMIPFTEFKDQEASHYGLKGSATSVERIFPPASHEGQIFIEGSDEEIAAQLTELFADRKYIEVER
ncbi:MAG: electron transfer flavoprotein subunit beta/FixA family protein [Clostridiales bacterium]|nr:electron transfer flavoprotein subunit beta/FixA family protein [Clostridiales bacterium]MDY3747236.1 electron transfer flavoprotein subunit beta/FixA family protein [Lachnospiraceae bacterium]